jgi:hypothetical protein
MRRIVLSLAVAASALLTACSGGGQVLGTGNNDPDRVIVSVAGQLNLARVLAGSSTQISAQDVKGQHNGAIYNNTFTWHAAIINGATYPTTDFNQSGTLKPCATVTLGTSTTPFAPDFTQFLTVDPANSANVTFNVPAVIPVPTGAPAAVLTPSANAYCVIVTATAVNGVVGSLTVAVVNPASPQQ